MRTLLKSRFGGLYFWGLAVLASFFLLRTVLLLSKVSEIGFRPVDVVQMYAAGLCFDAIAFFCSVLPLALYVTLAPDRVFRSRLNRVFLVALYAVAVFAMLFEMVSEWFFWDEFGHRFNFIAVDYLVYTNEVVGNIAESYPLKTILAVLLAATVAIVYCTHKYVSLCTESTSTLPQRLRHGLLFLAVPILAGLLVTIHMAEVSENSYVNEAAKNGLYSLVDAFVHNTLDYEQFYAVRDQGKDFRRLREMLATGDSDFADEDPSDITRTVSHPGPPQRHNVMLVVVESLSAEFMGVFGNQKELTPNLDAAAREGLLFTRLYATGTRTVRGLEAISMSIPPTPGCSVLKRADASAVFSLPRIFRQQGYDAVFMYGGYGYFDNMNGFFASNDCRIVDRADFARDEVSFTTAWGVCDENLFDKAIQQADAAAVRREPFFHLLMTTSNHRPYTYPQKIDIPSGSGRDGAVKYGDYALGELLRKSRRKPWFDDTVFVIVADHCANSAGSTALPADKYHIPMIVYAPKIVPAGRCDALCSQIDVGPTLLGMLNFSYRSKFFGKDVLRWPPGRALVGTYQRLGLLTEGTLTLLDVGRKSSAYRIEPDHSQTPQPVEQNLLFDAISYYQSASYLLRNHLYGPDNADNVGNAAAARTARQTSAAGSSRQPAGR